MTKMEKETQLEKEYREAVHRLETIRSIDRRITELIAEPTVNLVTERRLFTLIFDEQELKIVRFALRIANRYLRRNTG